MWKYIVVYWVIIIGTDKVNTTKNIQEFTERKQAIKTFDYLKSQSVILITGLKLDSLKIN